MLFPSVSSFSALLFAFFFFATNSPAALASQVGLEHQNLARSTESWTNAQRLSVGLPPLAPRRFKRATPTEPGVAKRAAPSPSPSAHPFRVAVQTSYTGTLQVRTVAHNTTLGFVRLSSSGVALGSDNGTPVSFTAVGNLPFSIATVTADENEVSFFGAAGNSAIASGSASTVALGDVFQSTPHARPTLTGGESAIWTIDANTLKLTPRWVNPDGSHARTILAHSASDGALVLTGDVSAYNQAHSDAPVLEVALFLVSN